MRLVHGSGWRAWRPHDRLVVLPAEAEGTLADDHWVDAEGRLWCVDYDRVTGLAITYCRDSGVLREEDL